MKYVLAFLLLIHGLIHLMGFVKAFHFGEIAQLKVEISKPAGVLWLLTALMFIAATILLLTNTGWWWMIGLAALLLSQGLVISTWSDAKFGTIANAIILVAVVAGFGSWQFERRFLRDVAEAFRKAGTPSSVIITGADLVPLPAPVQRYLRQARVVGKPRLTSVRIDFTGQMRGKGKAWFPMTTEQYNFFGEPTRLFFMKGKMFGLTVPGYHAYKDGKATMEVRLFGLIPVVNHKGAMLDTTETVTLFNDMCMMAPASLIDPRVSWEAIDDTSAKAIFTNHGMTVSAILTINAAGELTGWYSDDRYDVDAGKKRRFSTPAANYRDADGYRVCGYGEAIWHYDDGPFTYGQFKLNHIDYNPFL
jgi:hypothetical protein